MAQPSSSQFRYASQSKYAGLLEGGPVYADHFTAAEEAEIQHNADQATYTFVRAVQHGINLAAKRDPRLVLGRTPMQQVAREVLSGAAQYIADNPGELAKAGKEAVDLVFRTIDESMRGETGDESWQNLNEVVPATTSTSTKLETKLIEQSGLEGAVANQRHADVRTYEQAEDVLDEAGYSSARTSQILPPEESIVTLPDGREMAEGYPTPADIAHNAENPAPPSLHLADPPLMLPTGQEKERNEQAKPSSASRAAAAAASVSSALGAVASVGNPAALLSATPVLNLSNVSYARDFARSVGTATTEIRAPGDVSMINQLIRFVVAKLKNVNMWDTITKTVGKLIEVGGEKVAAAWNAVTKSGPLQFILAAMSNPVTRTIIISAVAVLGVTLAGYFIYRTYPEVLDTVKEGCKKVWQFITGIYKRVVEFGRSTVVPTVSNVIDALSMTLGLKKRPNMQELSDTAARLAASKERNATTRNVVETAGKKKTSKKRPKMQKRVRRAKQSGSGVIGLSTPRHLIKGTPEAKARMAMLRRIKTLKPLLSR